MLPTIIFLLVLFGLTLTVAAYSTYGERKVAAFMQDRIGPNRAGPFGIWQPLADGLKMFMKEDFVPAGASRTLFFMGPAIAMTVALITGVIIPWGDVLHIGGVAVPLQGMDPEVGILFVFAMAGIGVYGVMLGGWGSNNKYSLLGAIRAGSQMVSYELAMGLCIVALVMMTGTLSMNGIVEYQAEHGWNILYQPLGFIIFLTCAFAETSRTPFDLPECETELVGGYHTEYSSMKLGFYMFAEYVNMFIIGAVMATIYFGGYHVPFLADSGLSPNAITIIGALAMLAKTFFFIFLFFWVRWTLPRFRFDQLMNLGWKGFIPLAVVNILITAGIVIWQGHFSL